MLQPINELENWYKQDDPWKYENNSDDLNRKNILLSEIPVKDYRNVLDIGCGQGFITRDLPGKNILGVDISLEAINKARLYQSQRINFLHSSIFELQNKLTDKYDLIIITGVLYPQYIGNSYNLIYTVLDKLLDKSGVLVSVHIEDWYKLRFPYLMLKEYFYKYRDFTHRLEVYVK